jgi:hypothetical protein
MARARNELTEALTREDQHMTKGSSPLVELSGTDVLADVMSA